MHRQQAPPNRGAGRTQEGARQQRGFPAPVTGGGNKRQQPSPCARVRCPGGGPGGHREEVGHTGDGRGIPGGGGVSVEGGRAPQPRVPRRSPSPPAGLFRAATTMVFQCQRDSWARQVVTGPGFMVRYSPVRPGPVPSLTVPPSLCCSSPPRWCRARRQSCGLRAAGSRCGASRWCWRTPSSSPRVVGRYGGAGGWDWDLGPGTGTRDPAPGPGSWTGMLNWDRDPGQGPGTMNWDPGPGP